MLDVRALFTGDDYQTDVWIADAAAKAFGKYRETKENPRGVLIKKLQHYAANGFQDFEGKEKPIRPEGNGVFRIGLRRDLFRLIGFYDDLGKSGFIVVDTHLKSGQQRSKAYTDRVKKAAKIKSDGTWRKR